MHLERLLQVNVAALAALGTLLLCMGQRNAALPMLVLIAAVTSVWLTDLAGYFRLNRTVAGIAAVLAVLVSFRELFPLGGSLPILAIARLLIYLQIILLFQAKNIRIYWQLLMLSLLQVVVATVFNQGVWFGMLLVVYLFAALAALALLFLYREAKQYDTRPKPQPPTPFTPAKRRWPLAAHLAAFSGTAGGTLGQGMAGRDLFGRLAMMGLGTLVLTGVAFFALPRLGRPAWRSSILDPRRVVGYSDEVRLGELGQIIESPAEVMRVRFTETATGRPYPVHGDIYLHGTVLMDYSDGRWSRRGVLAARSNVLLEVTHDPPTNEVVRQNTVIEPMDRRELFCVRPFFITQRRPELRVDRRHKRLLRARDLCGQRFAYSLDTTGFVGGRQAVLLPAEETPSTEHLLQLPTADGPGGLPKMTELADRWIAQSGLPADDVVARTRCLEGHLRGSGEFQYSLQRQERDYTIDPIEDFVTNNPRGHCEYFATTLVLMLRTQGIPARLVVGYRCDEWNNLGKFFQVRQLHAHTWVEAYLRPDQIPPELIDTRRQEDWSRGGWLRLEPTATIAADESSGVGSLVMPLAKGINYLEFIWNNYVMEMDHSRQREAIYEPLVRSAKNVFRNLADPDWWCRLGKKLFQTLNVRNWSVDQWFSWRGGLTAMAVSLLLYCGYRGCRAVVRIARAGLARRGDRAVPGGRGEVEFYRRLQAVLARHGLARPASQTQHEFAITAGAAIAESTGQQHLALLPDRIVDAFYRVRFGHLTLDKPRLETVEHALVQLERTVGSGR